MLLIRIEPLDIKKTQDTQTYGDCIVLTARRFFSTHFTGYFVQRVEEVLKSFLVDDIFSLYSQIQHIQLKPTHFIRSKTESFM